MVIQILFYIDQTNNYETISEEGRGKGGGEDAGTKYFFWVEI